MKFASCLVNYIKQLLDEYRLEENAVRCPPGKPKVPAEEHGTTLVIHENSSYPFRDFDVQSLFSHSKHPDELILLGRGENFQLDFDLDSLHDRYRGTLNVINVSDLSPCAARNRGIQSAEHDIIALVDTDCRPSPGWLENITAPLVSDDDLGFIVGEIKAGHCGNVFKVAFYCYPFGPGNANLPRTMAYGKNIAFRKVHWAWAGGFPESTAEYAGFHLFQLRMQSLDICYQTSSKSEVRWVPSSHCRRPWQWIADLAQGEGQIGLGSTIKQGLVLLLALSGFLFLGLILYVRYPDHTLFSLFSTIFGVVILVTIWGVMISRKAGEFPDTSLFAMLFTPLMSMIRMRGYMWGTKGRTEAREELASEAANHLARIVKCHPGRKGILIYFPTHDWGHMFQRPQQMARAFASQGYLFFYCTANEKVDAVAKYKEVDRNLFLSSVPLETYNLLDRPTLYIGSPWYASRLAWFDQKQVIYDHYDSLAVSAARFEDHQKMVEESDLILVSSEVLKSDLDVEDEKVCLIPNAVDYSFVLGHKPGLDDDPPDDLAPILEDGKPVIGYIGALAKWFDYTLIAKVARNHPEWNFLLIGSDYDQSLPASGLEENHNVIWLGWKPYRELFSYLWYFEVGMIPFLINEITRAASPVKMYEYFACQKPVVATPLPECQRYPEVFIGASPQEFSARIQEAIDHRSSQEFLVRLKQIAKKNTWQDRVAAILSAIEM